VLALLVDIAPPLRIVIAKPGAHFVACTLYVTAVIPTIAIATVATAAVPIFMPFGHC
jgi:hypothetical protein